ncbi:hypothetical protein DFQ28_008332 [Apophysomyces sp. BC1034]|nr:hypothetical protein DFQ30_008054 [Apophysomyces sp. BC1015]KAG0175588.1 hypothetical protein DFQ29_007090 [Apophysomyces sp. BC1021]KAG0186100.1 hypothetical protein DFQ28_008332 [Apophysomyces sp. BC1034]
MYHFTADVMEPATLSTVTPAKSSKGRSKRKQVKNACVNCQKACKRCDEGRACQRCIKLGLTATCVNSPRKERQRGVKRGPYKKRQQRQIQQPQQQQQQQQPIDIKDEWSMGTENHQAMVAQTIWNQSCSQSFAEVFSPLSTSDQSDLQGFSNASSSTWSCSPSLEPMPLLFAQSNYAESMTTKTMEEEAAAAAVAAMFSNHSPVPDAASVDSANAWIYPMPPFSTGWPSGNNSSLLVPTQPIYQEHQGQYLGDMYPVYSASQTPMDQYIPLNLDLPNNIICDTWHVLPTAQSNI